MGTAGLELLGKLGVLVWQPIVLQIESHCQAANRVSLVWRLSLVESIALQRINWQVILKYVCIVLVFVRGTSWQ
jgi:hypothetical protein